MNDVIILDTNAVHDLDPHGSQADLIRMLRKTGMDIRVPWVVLEELTAHKLYEYQRAFGLMLKRHEELANLEPNLSGPVPEFKEEVFADHWREQYADVFATIPTSESALKAAVLREAACMRPAKMEKTNKSGGRDVAVWFSILDYMKQHPKARISFITNNTSDFGEPEAWPFPLNVDLGIESARIKQFPSIQEVLREFTQEKTPADGIADELKHRLESDMSLTTVARAAWRRLAPMHGMRPTKEIPEDVRLGSRLKSMGTVECRSIGDSLWHWVRVEWEIYLYSLRIDPPFTATWDTSILFPADQHKEISVLRTGRFTAIGLDELNPGLTRRLIEESLTLLNDSIANEIIPLENRAEEDQKARWHFASRRSVSPHLYEREVVHALRDITLRVRHTDGPGDFGADATIDTPEGAIAVYIKAGTRNFSEEDLVRAAFIPRELGKAVLIVTSREWSRTIEVRMDELETETSRPIEIAYWRDEMDSGSLRESVISLRRRMVTL
ncbi:MULTISPECIES: PIN domain-containing protein [Streptomyces]|uniref:PIN domain-containing protein n=1 Tax=Streptomyces TaxID=1883 RepID=UPI00131AD5DF|nr:MULTISPECIES: PIN domain-containing protein [Streptomyces]